MSISVLYSYSQKYLFRAVMCLMCIILVSEAAKANPLGVWAAHGKKCEDARLYFLINKMRMVAFAENGTIELIGEFNHIDHDSNKLAVLHFKDSEAWHLEFSDRNSGHVTKRRVDGQIAELPNFLKNTMRLNRCSDMHHINDWFKTLLSR